MNIKARQRDMRLIALHCCSLALICALAVVMTAPATFGGDPIPDTEAGYSIDTIDARAFAPQMQPPGIQLPAASAVDPSWYVSGALADGLSVLVVRLNPMQVAGQPVTFTISPLVDPNPQDLTPERVGSLWASFPAVPAPEAPNNAATTITVPAGSPAVVFYRPPESFLFGSGTDAQLLQITDYAGGEGIASTLIALRRPPLLLIHGILSSPAAMQPMAALLQKGFGAVAGSGIDVDYLDWSSQNDSGYDVVAPMVPGEISDELQRLYLRYNIAAVRLDVFAHSMGGVVTMLYACNTGDIPITRADGFQNGDWYGLAYPYLRNDDYGVGDIRRIVTIGSPFGGSPLADAVASNFGAGPTLDLAAATSGGNGDTDCFYDLGVLSGMTKFLATQHPQVSWLPLVGIAQPDGTIQELTQLDTVQYYAAICLVDTLQLNPTQLGLTAANSDFIVQDVSQYHLTNAPIPQHIALDDLVHTTEEPSEAAALQLMKSLDLLVPSPLPSTYTPGSAMFNPSF